MIGLGAFYQRYGGIIFVQLCVLDIQNIGNGVPHTEAGQQQRRASGNTSHSHKQAAFVQKQISGCHLMGEGKPLPDRSDPFQQDAFSGFRRFGQHQGSGHFPQCAPTGGEGGAHGAHQQHAHGNQSIIQPIGRNHVGAGIHNLVGSPNHLRQYLESDERTHNTAQQGGGSRIEEIFESNPPSGIAQCLIGADNDPLFLHHTGHGGQSYQRRYQEKDHREYCGKGVHPVGVIFKADKAHIGSTVQYIPLGCLNIVDFLLGVVDLILGVLQFLFRVGFLGVVFFPAFLQLGFTVFDFLLRVFQCLFVGFQFLFAFFQFRQTGVQLLLVGVNLCLTGFQFCGGLVQPFLAFFKLRIDGSGLGIQFCLTGFQLGFALFHLLLTGLDFLVALFPQSFGLFQRFPQRSGFLFQPGILQFLNLGFQLADPLFGLRQGSLCQRQLLFALFQLFFIVVDFFLGVCQLVLGLLFLLVECFQLGVILVLSPAQLPLGIFQGFLSLVQFFLGVFQLLLPFFQLFFSVFQLLLALFQLLFAVIELLFGFL